MDTSIEREKRKYTTLWADVPDYRKDSPGEMYIEHFLSFFEKEIKERDTLIDFGCGTGKVAKHFLEKGLFLTLVDFCDNCLDEEVALLTQLCFEQVRFVEACLWTLPDTLPAADWIYCCDVLEHIPEEHIDAVLAGMAARTKKGGYFSIHLAEDVFGTHLLGHPLHVTIKPKEWWQAKLSTHWQIASAPTSTPHIYHCCLLKKQ